VSDERDRLQALRRLISGDDRMAIVYTPTRSVTEGVARALVAAGHRAAPYHAGLDRARRAAILDAFLADRIDVVVATCAFGMGIDKPTVRLVVHWTLPPTPESYYQEAGRAGRDGEFARCVLLWHPRDSILPRRQLDVTFPPRTAVERLWQNPHQASGVPANVRESAERLGRELRPDLGPVDWEPVRQRRRRAEERLRVMEQYARASGCRRRALVGYFGETLASCAGCDRCRGEPVTRALPLPVVHRLTRLRQALGGRAGPWGGSLLEPDVLLRLARNPPESVGALADVAGVGPAVAERYGATILGALGVVGAAGSRVERSAAERALEEWRAAVAREMGVPAYVVLGDRALAQLAVGAAGKDYAMQAAAGPRFRAKFDAELRRLLERVGRSAGTAPSPPAP
jgi:ATP-dependent DNA helicase RecQ